MNFNLDKKMARSTVSIKTEKVNIMSISDFFLFNCRYYMQDRYTVLVCNRYAQLSCENDTVTESYQHFMQANNEAADELIPVKQKIKRI